MKIQIQIPRGDVYKKGVYKKEIQIPRGDVYKKEIQIPRGDVYKKGNSNHGRGRL